MTGVRTTCGPMRAAAATTSREAGQALFHKTDAHSFWYSGARKFSR